MPPPGLESTPPPGHPEADCVVGFRRGDAARVAAATRTVERIRRNSILPQGRRRGGGGGGGSDPPIWGTTAAAIAGGATGTVDLPGGGTMTGVLNPYTANASASKVCSVIFDPVAGTWKLLTFDNC